MAAATALDAVRFVFVNDGSTDSTATVLNDLVEHMEDRACVISLEENQGKAEAVRRGMQRALSTNAWAVGYWDADLATPLVALNDFRKVLGRARARAVIGSRIRLMGRRIERHASRHYAGRFFATLASMALGFPVYDTQCGAKIFRTGEDTRRVFSERFVTRWAFDVEVLARLAEIHGRDMGSRGLVVEQPLEQWTDVGGSKVKPSDLPRMLLDLARIRYKYR